MKTIEIPSVFHILLLILLHLSNPFIMNSRRFPLSYCTINPSTLLLLEKLQNVSHDAGGDHVGSLFEPNAELLAE